MMTRITVYYVTFLFFISTFSFSMIPVQTAFLEGGFESKNAYISFVVINDQRYIVKQKKSCDQTVSSVIRDALAAYIAQDLNIAPSVRIISSKDKIPGKIHEDCPAALMTIVPGKMIRALGEDHKYFQLSLQQRHPLDEKILNKWLDETIIHQITWHPQLPIIVALDIFLCNTDRHRGNLFYDEATDSFFPIDMDNIYRKKLAEFAYKNLKKMIRHKKKFSKQEIKALKIMKNTLEFLMQKYTADHIIEQLYKVAQQVGFVNDGSLKNNRIARKIALHKEIIYQSCRSLRALISILDDIIHRSVDI